MRRKNDLFMTELAVCLFLFLLAAAVCIGLLSHAGTLNRQSGELTEAVYLAQSAAEIWKGGGAPEREILPEGYRADFSEHGGSLDISIWKDGSLIYTLEGVSRLDEP